MKYHEAIKGPDGKLWKEEVAREHKRMVDSGVFEPVKISKVINGVKLIDTTWAMKKKSSGTLRGRVNVRGFKQINGQHYNGTSISVPVTNAMTIRIALTIMLMQSGIAHIMNVRAAFSLWGIQGQGETLHQDPIGIGGILPKQYCYPVEEGALQTQASGNGILHKASCCNAEYWAEEKHS
jgi:hypothetical protein